MTEIAQPVRAGLTTRAPSMRVWAMPLTLALATVAGVLPTLLSASGDRGTINVPVFLAGAGASLGTGLYDLARGRDVRFARVLIGAGLLWCFSALASSPESILYSVGRVSQWLVELGVIYLVLSYPSGRLTGRLQREVFCASALVVALLFLPTALIAQQFPSPSAWSGCTVGCPSNAFAIGSSESVLHVVVPLREVLTVTLLFAVAAMAVQRARTSGALLGRMYAPIALITALQTAALATYFRARALDPSMAGLDVLRWVYVLSLPTVALAAMAGRLYRRLFTAKALEQMAHELGTSATPAHVGRVMSEALEDPSLAVLHSFPDAAGLWVDESGAAVGLPGAETGRAVTEIANGNWRIALVHNPTLAEDPVLLQTAGSYALAALKNDKLTAELRTSLQALMEARVLGITAERRGRRKIERDIHDGAQQRLVALRIKLALTADKIGNQDAAGAEALRALGQDIDATIEEVRSFARGIYPPLLAETGLEGSVTTLARGVAAPTTVTVDGLGRYSREVETTVYFSISEALQNAAKHARGASSVTIRLWHDAALNFEVRDDGVGFDQSTTPHGAGLRGLIDRLAAVGGTIRIESVPGNGTAIRGTIPTSGVRRQGFPAAL
ncbi:MAG: sensor histidine kinase [Candidatus Limnocylindria bacterium]